MNIYVVSNSIEEDDYEMESQLLRAFCRREDADRFVRTLATNLQVKDRYKVDCDVLDDSNYITLIHDDPSPDDITSVFKVTYFIEKVVLDGAVVVSGETDGSVEKTLSDAKRFIEEARESI